MKASETGPTSVESRIAIVGMACRFPDANTPDAFWQNLLDGRSSVRDYDVASLRAAGVSESDLADPAYVRAGIPLDGFDTFDAAFFGVNPKEARVMDPQHRKFLECAWTALEDAGHTAESVGRNIGVFAGSGMHWYLLKNVMGHPALVRDMGEFLIRHTANDKDFMATRASYHLDLRGPSMNVQTACSTSLVAVHIACQSLLNGECGMALAGGSTIEIPHNVGYLYREGEIRSPDGRCRPLDADAAGTMFGSGCGVVVLRRLQDALADGDTIHAVILGSAMGNDGGRKAHYLAPSIEGQAQVIAEAIAVAGVDPESIGYVETGTGTRIGDPIEIAALTEAFGATARRQYCALGSVKSNIGHLDTASGVAGLIKVVLSLRHQKLPTLLHYRAPNPEVDWANTPFYVNATLGDWPRLGAPLRAGVSSMGVGGTNAHVVLEEAPDSYSGLHTQVLPENRSYILPLSARTPDALTDAARQLREHLETHPDASLADVAWTLQQGRVPFEYRMVVTGRNAAEIVAQLGAPLHQVRAMSAAHDVPTSPHREDSRADDERLAAESSASWISGANIDWRAWGQPTSGRRIPLPTYPFQRRRHWLEPVERVAVLTEVRAGDLNAVTLVPRPAVGSAYAAPESELQKALASMWGEMLEIDGIGIDDNFFELGGHSLLLTRLVSRLDRERGIALPIEQAFEVPTIAHWSALASSISSRATERPMSPVRRVDRTQYKVPAK